jgi:hypothetical protein
MENPADTPAQGRPRMASTSPWSLKGMTGLLILLLVAYPGWDIALRIGLVALFAAFMILPPLRRHVSIFCRCLLPILIGAICVEVYILVNDWAPAKDYLKYFRFDETYNETFYSAISTLYAIITALALVKGIEDLDETKKLVAEEAFRLRTIDEMSRYFDTSAGSALRQPVEALHHLIMDYAANVAALRDTSIRGENLIILRRCQQAIARLSPQDINDENSLNVMMSAHGELGTLRSKRINAIGDTIPGYLIVALWVMALGMVLPFMAGPLDASGNLSELRFGQYYIIFLMGSLNSFLLLMLSDISNRFDGFWQIDLSAFKDIADTLADELKGTPAPQPLERVAR